MKVTKFESSDANVIKYVFEFENPPAIAEAVVYKYPTFEDRTVICCSVQSGCVVGCTFCGTGKQFIRNLSSAEIEEQVHYIMSDNNIDSFKIQKFQIMFMSQGEPFHNYYNVKTAIINLNFVYPNAQLLVSTIAPNNSEAYRSFIELSNKIDKIGLQFSIHASTDEARNDIIAFGDKIPLAGIAILGETWHKNTGRQPFLNYCVTDKNSSDEDVDNLVKLFNPNVFQMTLSVICEKDETIKGSQDRQLVLIKSFMNKLISKGYSCRMFNPGGQDDIGGGCGQLWYVQDWLKKKKANVDWKDEIKNKIYSFSNKEHDITDGAKNYALSVIEKLNTNIFPKPHVFPFNGGIVLEWIGGGRIYYLIFEIDTDDGKEEVYVYFADFSTGKLNSFDKTFKVNDFNVDDELLSWITKVEKYSVRIGENK